ncbi:MAG: hypothetical protein ACK5UE_02060 [Chitinophagales bacterium]|jgi:hypothetical protein|nr:hypothetical protein [Sphingobacteriales bacterium]
MKKLLFTAILLSSLSVYSQTAPTPTQEELKVPTPPPTVVVDPNTNNSNTNEAEVTRVEQSGDVVNGAPDTHLGGTTTTVVEPTAVAPSGDVVNGAPARHPVSEDKNPTPKENPVDDNTKSVEVSPTIVE